MMFQNMTGRICSFSRVRSFEKKRSLNCLEESTQGLREACCKVHGKV
ncbi:MAG: hypothetical protein ACLTCP_04865 [Ruminococcus bicirculans (ex Wegman et al. 2014)]